MVLESLHVSCVLPPLPPPWAGTNNTNKSVVDHTAQPNRNALHKVSGDEPRKLTVNHKFHSVQVLFLITATEAAAAGEEVDEQQ